MPDPTTTTLYRPVLIESAEQAEALPIGTVALLRFGHRTKTTDGWWETPTGGGLDESRAVVGAQALVPIEAEEEAVACGNDWSIPVHEGLMPNGDVVPNGWTIHTRLVTPWEPVTDPDRRGDCA